MNEKEALLFAANFLEKKADENEKKYSPGGHRCSFGGCELCDTYYTNFIEYYNFADILKEEAKKYE
jgi:hypothetical protein